jgi:hypothetical protein
LWLLREEDIVDWPSLARELRAKGQSARPSPAGRIWAMLGAPARQAVASLDRAQTPAKPVIRAGPAIPAAGAAARQAANQPATAAGAAARSAASQPAPAATTRPAASQPAPAAGAAPDPATLDKQTKPLILAALNDILADRGFYDAQYWRGAELTPRQEDLLAARRDGTDTQGEIIELNRSLLADALSGTISQGPTVLAVMDTSDLRLQLAEPKAELLSYLRREAVAMRDRKIAEAQIARAEVDRLQAQIDLLEYRIRKARIVSPLSGKVLTGDLKHRIGAPIKTGDVLFEVAPLETLRADLSIPEDQIADVMAALKTADARGEKLQGQLATVGKPDQRVGFVVERIDPVAQVVDQANVFKVRAGLNETRQWMLPGMEGVAKIHLGNRKYAWLWSRKLVNWVRMKLWI